MAPFLHQLKMINKQKAAESLNSLGHHLPESVNLFAICSCAHKGGSDRVNGLE